MSAPSDQAASTSDIPSRKNFENKEKEKYRH
jgi:hypothetical protein